MITTRVFQSGNSQAVRIPQEFQLDVSEVEIFKRGEELVLRKKPTDLSKVLGILSDMPEDFMADGRDDPSPQDRDFDQ